jgi:hypothetical protein
MSADTGGIEGVADGPFTAVVDEARRVVAAADAANVALRIAGGVGVALCCPSASDPPLLRAYADIDVVGHANQRRRITELLARLGYEADTVFNATHGARRLFFWDTANGRQLDVFLDKIEMCHVIDLGRRLDVPGPALAPADLLLLKLQVMESNEKDLLDIGAILVDQELAEGSTRGVNTAYLARLCADDWRIYWRIRGARVA